MSYVIAVRNKVRYTMVIVTVQVDRLKVIRLKRGYFSLQTANPNYFRLDAAAFTFNLNLLEVQFNG